MSIAFIGDDFMLKKMNQRTKFKKVEKFNTAVSFTNVTMRSLFLTSLDKAINIGLRIGQSQLISLLTIEKAIEKNYQKTTEKCSNDNQLCVIAYLET